MSFKVFKLDSAEVIINTDNIISIMIDPNTGKTTIACTYGIQIPVDDTMSTVKEKLGLGTSDGMRRTN